jgi:acetyl esterase/lipase
MKQALIILSSIIVFVSCQKSTDVETAATLSAQTMTNVAYGSNGAQVMDVYLPAGRSVDSTKAIVLIHGGAWTTGDKSDFTSDVDTLKRRLPNYAIFNINYRLSVNGANTFPAQENDVQSALDFIVSKATEYKFNKNKLVLLGASAGGHLALLQAYKHTSPTIKAVVDFFGPTDMVDMYNNPPNPLIAALLPTIVGGTPATNAALYAQSSPINYVTATVPPTIILHGGQDIVVSISQSTSLKTKLTTFGVVNQMFTYPTEGHGWVGANLTDSYNKVEAFIKANVR